MYDNSNYYEVVMMLINNNNFVEKLEGITGFGIDVGWIAMGVKLIKVI